MNNQLSSFLRERVPAGLEYDQAVQLCLHIFCRAGVVPIDLAPLTSKEGLADAFSELASEGWVHLSSSNSSKLVSDPAHWLAVVKSFMLGNTNRNSEQG